MLDRRAFLASAAAVSIARPALAADAPAVRSPRLAALFDDFFHAGLRLRPETATQLGLDTGTDADLRGRLSDPSDAGRAAQGARTQDELRRLAAIDPATLSPADRLDYDVVLYTRRSSAAQQRFDYGGSGYGPSPYVVSQLTGAYQSVPDFLDTKHPIASKADCDAYLSRLSAFARQLDAETGRMRHDAGMGVVPPDFILDLTLAQMAKLRVPAADALVVSSITKRAAAKGLGDGYGPAAARIYEAEVLPALDRQIAQAKAMRGAATHDAGMWRLPQGADFYAAALQTTTTTRLSPEEVHKFGLDQARAISARLDG